MPRGTNPRRRSCPPRDRICIERPPAVRAAVPAAILAQGEYHEAARCLQVLLEHALHRPVGKVRAQIGFRHHQRRCVTEQGSWGRQSTGDDGDACVMGHFRDAVRRVAEERIEADDP